jgi:L-arabinokinase
MLVAYVSGHGFGHATRAGEVLRGLRSRARDVGITVVTSGPEGLYRRAIPGSFAFRSFECDVGLVQADAVTIDEAATAARAAAFAVGWEARVASEAAWLRTIGARVVLGDVPPLAFAAAAAAKVPSIALANFSWDWIYRHLARRQPALGDAAAQAAAAYGRAGLLLQLPFAGDLSAFPRREPIPLVARRPRVPREEARRRLGLGARPAVLVSFSGPALPGMSLEAAAREFAIMTSAADPPAGGVSVHEARLEATGLEYVDVVGAADVVVSKPGYGIVSDAIGAGSRLVYTDRGDFPEYEVLVREMPRYLPCAYVSHEELRAGRLAEPVRRVLAEPVPDPPDLDGACRAAERLLERL